ncbi:MAG: DEAD/DEAH box helicase [Deltaproteobacteria bacterium]|nr:DEAD/DEAH box helicase [Deltaproteobacteria bacterium]
MQKLFERVRGEAERSVWSTGVELARTNAVTQERAAAGEVVLRVRPPRGIAHPTVLLYVDDAEWECDCGDDEDPCAHVAAAVIALRRAQQEGRELAAAAASSAGAIAYRFNTDAEGLSLTRVVVREGKEEPLRASLSALRSGRVAGPPVSPTQSDVAAEIALGNATFGVLPRGVLRALLAPLEACDDIALDGAKIRTSREPVAWRARLVDDGAAFRLVVLPDPPVTRALPDGFALCGDVLRELGPSRLTGREREELRPPGRFVSAHDVAALVADVIPELERRVPVDIDTTRLARGRREPPRLRIETERRGDKLSVLATIVYGDPPIARVDAGKLVALGGAIPIRDEAAERELARRLAQQLELSPGHRADLTAGDAIRFRERLERTSVSVSGSAHREFFLADALTPALDADDARFGVRFRSGARDADAGAVIGAWRAGESLVPLLGGGFAKLPAGWLAKLGPLVADLLAARRLDGSLPASALPDLARLCDALEQPRPPAFEKLAALLEDFTRLPEAPIARELAAKLRSYQGIGVRWLHFLGRAGLGALLADDMGLGKTLQALATFGPRTLVVAPTSLLANWQGELARFRPELEVHTYHGADRELEYAGAVTLTTYALLRRDAEKLAAVPWELVVLDEAQAIKNPDSQTARAAFGLRAERRIALTGTPVENRLEELWSEMHFLNPGLLGGRSDFDERYARKIASADAEAAAHLRERLRPFVLRRRKAEVAPELPPRTDVVLHCVLSDAERAVYDAVRAATTPAVLERLARGGSVMEALEALLRMRQASCHPRLVPGQTLDASAKLELLVDRLDTVVADGHKALVFSQWTALLDLVEPRLRDAGVDFVRLDGATRDRGEVVARFQAETGPPVFLISLRAGGVGLNLTAADHVFLLDPWWNPAVEDQAADRAHRIGQERPVLVHRLVAQDTVEERILALQESKRALAAAALDGGPGAELTREDLIALLR